MNEKKAPWPFLLILILAGESVFVLPFVLSRVFRPTVLEVFDLDNIELGLCFSVYGIIALVAYILGGPIADKYPPRKLIAWSLWLTGLGGFYYATFPSYTMLKLLYAYWGFTTIFLLWAPMIKATRIWGGSSSQGQAFGFLDGGRGIVGALFGILGLFIFSSLYVSGNMASDNSQTIDAFRNVIIASSIIVILVGFLAWYFMKMEEQTMKQIVVDRITFSQIKKVIMLPSVWMLMVIILCAYVGYKITDIFSLYAQDVMLYDQVESARVGTYLISIRPIVGIIVGLTVDRSKILTWLPISFALTFIGSLFFALDLISPSSPLLFLFSVLIVACGVYALRSLYFAVMEKGQIPLIYTGTAVGLISLIGYTPDIFASPFMGYLLERTPGPIGHQHVFWMMAFFALVGGLVSWKYYRAYD